MHWIEAPAVMELDERPWSQRDGLLKAMKVHESINE